MICADDVTPTLTNPKGEEVVAHEPAREADQDRRESRQSRSLRHVSDVRGDHAEHRCFSSTAAGNGNMSAPAIRACRKTTGDLRAKPAPRLGESPKSLAEFKHIRLVLARAGHNTLE